MLGQGGETRNSHHCVLGLPYPASALAALLSAGRAVLGKQSTVYELPHADYIKLMEVARDFLGPGALPNGEFVSSDTFLPHGGGVIWAGVGEEEEERLTSLVGIQRPREHPASVFHFAQKVRTPVWEIRIIHPALWEPCMYLGFLAPQNTAQLPALVKVATFALELPGSRHVRFCVTKLTVRFFCHW